MHQTAHVALLLSAAGIEHTSSPNHGYGIAIQLRISNSAFGSGSAIFCTIIISKHQTSRKMLSAFCTQTFHLLLYLDGEGNWPLASPTTWGFRIKSALAVSQERRFEHVPTAAIRQKTSIIQIHLYPWGLEIKGH